MSHHFTETAIGLYTLAYCPKCGRMTNHRVDRVAVGSHAGKVGPCMEHGTKWLSGKQQSHAAKILRATAQRRRQPRLFE